MISFENPSRPTYKCHNLFRWCSHGVALGQNMLNLNVKFDLVVMATVVYSTISSKNVLVQKAFDFGNTKKHRFLHPFKYLVSYSKLTIWIFDYHKSGPPNALMT